MTGSERFWARVASSGPHECWPYIGPLFSDGYGRWYRRGVQRTTRAHREAWRLANGSDIPEGMLVCHHCDNPPCCNPAHLFLGTRVDNAADMHAKGRCRNHREWGAPARRSPRGLSRGLPFFFAGIAARLEREAADGRAL